MAIVRLVAGTCALLLFFTAGTADAGSWQVVLAAGDDTQPVFDNATRAFERLLLAEGVASPNIHRLSAAPDAADPASLCRRVDQRFTQLSRRPTGGAAGRLEPANPAASCGGRCGGQPAPGCGRIWLVDSGSPPPHNHSHAPCGNFPRSDSAVVQPYG
jgi:hypothetical protein